MQLYSMGKGFAFQCKTLQAQYFCQFLNIQLEVFYVTRVISYKLQLT